MNKEIAKLLKEYGMLDEEIVQCFVLCEGLNIVDETKARACITTLVEKGYPKEDVGLLLAINPAILMYEADVLSNQLDDLGDDIEDILKNDPFAI